MTATWNDDYGDSVREFLEHANWIGPAERPLAVQLRALAASLDADMRERGSVQSAAASQFAQTWARLAKRDPAQRSAPADAWDDLLQPLPGMENGLGPA